MIAVVVDAYLSSLESAHSRTGYRHDWGAFTAWLAIEKIDPLEARPSVMQRYIAHLQQLGRSKPTRARALSAIRSIYDALVVNDLLATNPARSVKNVKTSSTPNAPFLEESAAARLLVAARTAGDSWEERRDRLCLLLIFGLGLRRSEIARIHVEDIVDGQVRYIAKGNKPAVAEVPTWLLVEIEEWLPRRGSSALGPLLPTHESSRTAIKDTVVYAVVKAAAAKAGFKPDEVTPHGLRRTLATIASERGVALKDVQRGFHHASSKTTERYVHDTNMKAPGEGLADLVYGKLGETSSADAYSSPHLGQLTTDEEAKP